MERVLESFGGNRWAAMQAMPTALWYLEWTDENLNRLAHAGLGISVLVLALGAANIPLMIVLWALYQSIVNVGGSAPIPCTSRCMLRGAQVDRSQCLAICML